VRGGTICAADAVRHSVEFCRQFFGTNPFSTESFGAALTDFGDTELLIAAAVLDRLAESFSGIAEEGLSDAVRLGGDDRR
jgi:hypothetical protein